MGLYGSSLAQLVFRVGNLVCYYTLASRAGLGVYTEPKQHQIAVTVIATSDWSVTSRQQLGPSCPDLLAEPLT